MELPKIFGFGKKKEEKEAAPLTGITVNNIGGTPLQMESANDNDEDPNVAAALASIHEDVEQATPPPKKAVAGVPAPQAVSANLEKRDAEDDSGLQTWNASIQNMREKELIASAPAAKVQDTIVSDTETPQAVVQHTPTVAPESIETKKPSKLVGLGPFERGDPPPSQSVFSGAPKMVPPRTSTPAEASPSNRLSRMREPSQTVVGEQPVVPTLEDRLARAGEGARTVAPDASPIEPTSSFDEKVSATDIIEDTLATIGGVGTTFKHEEKVAVSAEPQAPIAPESTNAEIEATEAQAPAVGVPASAFKEVVTSPEATVAAPKHEGEDRAEDIPERITPFFSAQFTTDIARRLNARGLQDELNSVLNFFEEHYNEPMDSFDDVVAIESDDKPDILRDEWFTKELLLHFAIEKYMRSLAAQGKESDSLSV